MKLFYRQAGTDEPLTEIPDVKPFQLHPIAPVEDEQEAIDAHDVAKWTNTPQQMIWQGDVKLLSKAEKDFRRAVKQLLRPTKYPRKLKKAVKQMWEKKWDGATWEITFKPKRKTKWQRKAYNKIRKYDNRMEFPMPSGRTMVLHWINPSS
jgi:hypothetical protein